MKTFIAERTASGSIVTMDGLPMPADFGDGFANPPPYDWGNSGEGARGLSFALLENALESEHLADDLMHEYLLAVVSHLPNSGWTMTDGDVWAWALSVLLVRFAKIVGRGPSCIIV